MLQSLRLKQQTRWRVNDVSARAYVRGLACGMVMNGYGSIDKTNPLYEESFLVGYKFFRDWTSCTVLGSSELTSRQLLHFARTFRALAGSFRAEYDQVRPVCTRPLKGLPMRLLIAQPDADRIFTVLTDGDEDLRKAWCIAGFQMARLLSPVGTPMRTP